MLKKRKETNLEKPKNAIFLYDYAIRPWNPKFMDVPKQFGVPDTQIRDYLHRDSIEEEIGRYLLTGSVVKYLAGVVRYDEKKDSGKLIAHGGDGIFVPSQEILFVGGLQIYKWEVIPGTQIEGYHEIAQGKALFARKPIVSPLDDSLFEHLFSGRDTVRKKISTVEAIANGYIQREKEERERHWDAVSSAYGRGSGDARERAFGTFGSGC